MCDPYSKENFSNHICLKSASIYLELNSTFYTITIVVIAVNFSGLKFPSAVNICTLFVVSAAELCSEMLPRPDNKVHPDEVDNQWTVLDVQRLLFNIKKVCHVSRCRF